MLEIFILAASPFCTETPKQAECVAWATNFMMADYVADPSHDIDWYTENMAENLPERFSK